MNEATEIKLTAREARKIAMESRAGLEEALTDCMKTIDAAARFGMLTTEFSGFVNQGVKTALIVELQKAGFDIPDAAKQAMAPKSPLLIKW